MSEGADWRGAAIWFLIILGLLAGLIGLAIFVGPKGVKHGEQQQPQPRVPEPDYDALEARLSALNYTDEQIDAVVSDVSQLDNATLEAGVINALMNLTDAELEALMSRMISAGESVIYGDWDRSGGDNLSELLSDNPHHVLDPSNLCWRLNETSIRYVDAVVYYRDHPQYHDIAYLKGIDMLDTYTPEGIRDVLVLIDESGSLLGIVNESGAILLSPRECHIGFMLGSYPHTNELITNKTLRFLFVPAVKQIDASVYPYVVLQAAEHRTPEECRESERYAWEIGIDPAVGHILRWIRAGDIDLSLLRDNYTDVEQGQVLFPMTLCVYDMEKMQKTYAWQPYLQALITNVQPAEKYGGKTPWEHWHDVAKQGFSDPEFRERCFSEARSANAYPNWPILRQSFLEVFDNMTQQDPFCVYLMGFPYEVGVGEQYVEGFESIPSSFGRPSWTVSVHYHTGATHQFFAVKSMALSYSGNNKGYYYQGWNGTAWEEEFGGTYEHPKLPPSEFGRIYSSGKRISGASAPLEDEGQTPELASQTEPTSILSNPVATSSAGMGEAGEVIASGVQPELFTGSPIAAPRALGQELVMAEGRGLIRPRWPR